MVKYKYVMLIIGTFGNVIKSMDKCNDVRNLFFLSISHQTFRLFNEYDMEIFNHYKNS